MRRAGNKKKEKKKMTKKIGLLVCVSLIRVIGFVVLVVSKKINNTTDNQVVAMYSVVRDLFKKTEIG
jgi:hypothetical protein